MNGRETGLFGEEFSISQCIARIEQANFETLRFEILGIHDPVVHLHGLNPISKQVIDIIP